MIQKWGGLAIKSPLSEDFCQLIILPLSLPLSYLEAFSAQNPETSFPLAEAGF